MGLGDCQSAWVARLAVLLALISTATSSALVGGIAARPTDLPSVFIWTTSDVELKESFCTASKIGSDLLLTAAHCVLAQETRPGETQLGPWKYIPSMSPGQILQYSFARSLRERSTIESLTVREVVLAPVVISCIQKPGARPEICEREVPAVDLAIVRVSGGGSFARAPVAKMRKGPVAPGTAVLLTGYGAEREKQTEAPRLSFQWATVTDWRTLNRALASTEAKELGALSPSLFFGVYSDYKDPRHTNLGSGDSGGPIFDARTGEIIGVNSTGYCPLVKRDCEVANNSFFALL